MSLEPIHESIIHHFLYHLFVDLSITIYILLLYLELTANSTHQAKMIASKQSPAMRIKEAYTPPFNEITATSVVSPLNVYYHIELLVSDTTTGFRYR